MNPAVTIAAAGLTLQTLNPPGVCRVASSIFYWWDFPTNCIVPERRQNTALAIFATRSDIRSKGIGGVAHPLGRLALRSPLKFLKSHASHKLPGKSRRDLPDLFPGLIKSFVSFVCRFVHGPNHEAERLTCPTSVVQDFSK